MARRAVILSLADVIAISVSTVLLIGMLCGLTFFILEVAYHGSFLGTLQWVLFFFVVAIVLIARIALTTDRARAIAYGMALALATALAINKFVELPAAGMLGRATGFIPYTLLGLIWWCAYILTKDCTHTEESADDAGLLDAPPAAPADAPGAWLRDYERERETERRRHRPGTWLVYFSLGSLPLFVLGQLLIPASEASRRFFAFWMLTLYLSCALSLLSTTSFLGLRRYLDQRRLAMPWKMTGVWLGLSISLILTILLLAALLPRPHAEYGLGRLWAKSQQQAASDQALVKLSGGEGQGQDGGKGAQGQKPQTDNQGQRDPKADAPPAPGQQGQGAQPQGGQQQPQGQGQGQGNQQGQGGQGQNQPQDQPQEQKDARDQQERKQNQGGPTRRERQTDREHQQDQPRAGAPQADNAADVPENRGNPMNERLMPEMSMSTPWWLWLIVLIALAAAAYWYRNELLAFLQGLWPKVKLSPAPIPTAAAAPGVITEPTRPPPPFASFRNPFEHLSDFESSEAVVRYSFAALQSWAHEQDLGRAPEETPLEFADRLGEERPGLEKPSRRLAEVYAQVSYAQAKVGPKGLAMVREFWESLPPPREPVARA